MWAVANVVATAKFGRCRLTSHVAGSLCFAADPTASVVIWRLWWPRSNCVCVGLCSTLAGPNLTQRGTRSGASSPILRIAHSIVSHALCVQNIKTQRMHLIEKKTLEKLHAQKIPLNLALLRGHASVPIAIMKNQFTNRNIQYLCAISRNGILSNCACRRHECNGGSWFVSRLTGSYLYSIIGEYAKRTAGEIGTQYNLPRSQHVLCIAIEMP